MQANKAAVQNLKRQLTEQQTKSGDESAARRSEIGGLQQCLASKTRQLDKLAADHKTAREVGFHIMYALMHCDHELC